MAAAETAEQFADETQKAKQHIWTF